VNLLGEGVEDYRKNLPKFFPQAASKLGNQLQTAARRRKDSKLPGGLKDADHQ
jgi:hypothetical protein